MLQYISSILANFLVSLGWTIKITGRILFVFSYLSWDWDLFLETSPYSFFMHLGWNPLIWRKEYYSCWRGASQEAEDEFQPQPWLPWPFCHNNLTGENNGFSFAPLGFHLTSKVINNIDDPFIRAFSFITEEEANSHLISYSTALVAISW